MNFVYFIRSEASGAIKIGVSQDPLRRVDDIQKSNGEPVTLIGVIRGDRHREKQLHEQFAEGRAHGEWFHLVGEAQREIEDLLAQEAIDENFLQAVVVKSGNDHEIAEETADMVHQMMRMVRYSGPPPDQQIGYISTIYDVNPRTLKSLYYRTPEFVTAGTYLTILRAYKAMLAEHIEHQRKDIERSQERLHKIDKTLSDAGVKGDDTEP